MRSFVLVILVTLSVISGTAAAQEDACPADATCYAGHELEFNAADGFIQFLVVETDSRITETLDGETVKPMRVTLAMFISTGDMYEFVDEYTYPADGVLATASVGDTFGLTELGGGE